VGWRRDIFKAFVALNARFVPEFSERPEHPKSVFVLRNNDIGDLLVITPLFEALRKGYPDANIVAGIGSWNREILIGNPYVTRILEINGPWHNNFVADQSLPNALRYIYLSDELQTLRQARMDIGIDVLGSGFGSLLMMRALIPYRLGVKGYAGGDSVAQACVSYRPDEHVGRQALRLAELLGCKELPENRPQIFLDFPPEPHGAIVVAPGAGLPQKRWPIRYFTRLAGMLKDCKIFIIGSRNDTSLAAQILENNPNAEDLCGRLNLRETFAVIGGARLVICNSSMALHAAAAFHRPTIVILSDTFPSSAEHRRQWCYPETMVLGRDQNRNRVFVPEEVEAVVREVLNAC
jgi:heptosyltransferase-2